MLFELFNVRHCGNVEKRVGEVADERKRRTFRTRIGKRRGLLATEHLFSKTKDGLNILTDVGRKTIEFRKQERAKGTEKVCNIATGPTGIWGNSSGGRRISKV